jgi:erythritol kinase
MASISVDAGTTMIKAVGYNGDGTEAAVERQATSITRPNPGWVEQDMGEVWDAVATTVRAVAAQLDSPVDFISITAQGDGAWLVDGSGSPTGPAILWNDGRGVDLLSQWTDDGVLERAFQINGNLTSSGMPNVILSWLYEHDRGRLERSKAVLTCGGWIFSQMTGELAIDESDASAPFMDIGTRHYSPELLALYGMEWAAGLLPEIRDDHHRAAVLTPAASAVLGLPEGLPVVMAPYDIAATAIGAGVTTSGKACTILGTTICPEILIDAPQTNSPAAGLNIASGLGTAVLRSFPTLSGGEVVTWVSKLLGITTPEAFMDLAASSGPGAAGLLFLPYFSPAGERAPFLNPQARGMFSGLSFEHNRAHVVRAVLEGLTFVIRDCLEAAGGNPTELTVCGGGAASSTWLQLIANITGLPVRRSLDNEIGARGAFLVGLHATGAAPSIAEAAARHVRIRDSFLPEPAMGKFYDELFKDFLALRESAEQSWGRLAAMRQRSATMQAAMDKTKESAHE